MNRASADYSFDLLGKNVVYSARKSNVRTLMPYDFTRSPVMAKETVCTTIDEIEAIPQEMLPMLVLSANNKSFLSWAIERRTNSHYAHLMWLHRPGFFATQDLWYRESPIQKYKDVRLKLWHNKLWRPQDKAQIIFRINAELDKSKWETRYDFLAIAGQLLGFAHIENPWAKICSDWANLLKLSDKDYNLEHPDPGDVNQWLKEHEKYVCHTRYLPD
jgi:hypothetical protein